MNAFVLEAMLEGALIVAAFVAGFALGLGTSARIQHEQREQRAAVSPFDERARRAALGAHLHVDDEDA